MHKISIGLSVDEEKVRNSETVGLFAAAKTGQTDGRQTQTDANNDNK